MQRPLSRIRWEWNGGEVVTGGRLASGKGKKAHTGRIPDRFFRHRSQAVPLVDFVTMRNGIIQTARQIQAAPQG